MTRPDASDTPTAPPTAPPAPFPPRPPRSVGPLALARLAAGYSIARAALALGLSPGTLRTMERAAAASQWDHSALTLGRIRALGELYSVPLRTLVPWLDERI